MILLNTSNILYLNVLITILLLLLYVFIVKGCFFYKCSIFFQRLSTKTTVADIYGKELPAVDIFSHAIKYLKDHMINEHKNRGTTIVDSDINWVLTVPAIWDDPAKQFMRKAAEKVNSVRHYYSLNSNVFSCMLFQLFTSFSNTNLCHFESI